MKVLIAQRVEGIAGSEKYLIHLLPALNKSGVRAEFLLLYRKGKEEAVEEFEGRLTAQRIHVHKVSLHKVPSRGDLKEINAVIEAGKFDLVHSNLLVTDVILAFVKMLFNRNLVLVSCKHGYDEAYTTSYGFDPSRKKRSLYWWCARFAEQFINHSFAVSNGVRDLFIGLGIAKQQKIDLVQLGFDFEDDYKVTDPAFQLGSPQLVIVGRLTAYKGHRFAIQAIRLLIQKYPQIKLLIVGWGELESELKALVNRLQVDRHVVFTGFHPRPREIMYNSDIVLLPSVSEGFGIVVLEAMSVKRPVVAFNVPSPSEIFVHGKTALLAEPYSVEEYAKLIESLIENKQYRQKIAENAYQQLKVHYNLKRMVNETIAIYQSVITRQKIAPPAAVS